MARDQRLQRRRSPARRSRLQINGSTIASLLREVAALVKDVRDPAVHAGGKVSSALPQNDDQAVGHVLAAVIAHALHNRRSSRVANRKAFAGYSIQEDFATGCAVENDIADQNAFLRLKAGVARRKDNNAAA